MNAIDGAGPTRVTGDRRPVPGAVRRPAVAGGGTVPAAVAGLATTLRVPVPVVVLAGFLAVLARYAGQPVVTIAVSDARGTRLVSAEPEAGRLTFAGLVDQLAVRPAPGPWPAGQVAPIGYAFDGVAADAAAGSELLLRVGTGPAATLELAYDATVFTEPAVRRLLGHLDTLLAAGVAEPATPVAALPLLSAAELQQALVTWNDTGVELPLPGPTLHAAFTAQARRRPDAVALAHSGGRLTFLEIEHAANRLAHQLRAGGVGRGSPVGLCLSRGPDVLVAALAVLKTDGAYVPLDPAHPLPRLQAMVRDAGCAVVVTQSAWQDRFDALPVALVRVDADAAAIARQPATAPEGVAGPDDLCYVIYTSGSTGSPKGIAVRHGGVLNNLVDLNTRYRVGPGDAVLALSSLSFDMSVYEFLGVPIGGGTVVVPEPDRARNPAHWLELVHRHRVTVWNTAPSLLELAVGQAERTGDRLDSLRLALVGGDWIPVSLPDRLRALAPQLTFVSLGGATEASIHSTIYEVGTVDPEWLSIPYGRPMANQRTYVLDPAGRPVPVGVAGELCLAGAGLARGYVGDPRRTAERFFDWSHPPVAAERVYRTGDLARYRPDGQLELLGRIDHQVKIRGVRVETGEVEAAVRTHPAVQVCAVVAVSPGDRAAPQLVAYVVSRPGRPVSAIEIRDRVAELLPEPMVPSRVTILDELPLSPNGKVDRAVLSRGLPGPDPQAPEPPRDEWERRVAAVWQAALDGGPIGRDSNFFDIGGDSFVAMLVVQDIDPDLSLAELFRHPTVKGLAARLRERASQPADSERLSG